jgi:hypothetical protein
MRLHYKLLIFKADDSICEGIILTVLLGLISNVTQLLSIPVEAATATTDSVHDKNHGNPSQDEYGMLESEKNKHRRKVLGFDLSFNKLIIFVDLHQFLLGLYHIRCEVKESHIQYRFRDSLWREAPVSTDVLAAGLFVSIALLADAGVDWSPTASECGGCIS